MRLVCRQDIKLAGTPRKDALPRQAHRETLSRGGSVWERLVRVDSSVVEEKEDEESGRALSTTIATSAYPAPARRSGMRGEGAVRNEELSSSSGGQCSSGNAASRERKPHKTLSLSRPSFPSTY